MSDGVNAVSVEIAKLVVKTGDVLVVKCDRPITDETARRIEQHLKPLLPEGVKIMVLDGNLQLAILTKEQIESRVA